MSRLRWTSASQPPISAKFASSSEARTPSSSVISFLFVKRVLLLHHVVQVLVAHDDRVQHGVLVVLEVILLQNGHPLLGE
jgi:hypothetical protein